MTHWPSRFLSVMSAGAAMFPVSLLRSLVVVNCDRLDDRESKKRRKNRKPHDVGMKPPDTESKDMI